MALLFTRYPLSLYSVTFNTDLQDIFLPVFAPLIQYCAEASVQMTWRCSFLMNMYLSLAAFAIYGLDFSGYTKYGQAHILIQGS